MSKQINFNAKVTVQLTEAGRRHLLAYHRKAMGELIHEYPMPPGLDDDGTWYYDELWEVMHIFGPMLRQGTADVPFVGGLLRFKDEDVNHSDEPV